MPAVLQDWVCQLPYKQQSILLGSFRGPDSADKLQVRQLTRFIRLVSQKDADPSKDYLKGQHFPALDQLEGELECLSAHYIHHLADSLAVIAYNHPDEEIRKRAYSVHAYIAEELFHFIPETPEIFAWRHRDKLAGADTTPVKPFADREFMEPLLPEGYQHR